MIPLPGLTAFNMTSGELINSSTAGLSLYRTLVSGAAELFHLATTAYCCFWVGVMRLL